MARVVSNSGECEQIVGTWMVSFGEGIVIGAQYNT
jgi:hypothetical protein